MKEDSEPIEDRWFRYKQNERKHGREPMTWREWLAANMPAPLMEGDE